MKPIKYLIFTFSICFAMEASAQIKAKFTYCETHKDTVVTFTNLSKTNINTTYYWEFGDGNSSNSKSPVHRYNRYDTFDVRLIITDTLKIVSDSFEQKIILRPTKCNPSALDILNCKDLKLFNWKNRVCYSNYTWTFGDGNFININNNNNDTILHPYIKSGSYNLQLVAWDSNKNCVPDTFRKTIKIKSHIVPKYTIIRSGDKQVNVNIDKPGNGYSYEWDYGDGITEITTKATHIYKNYGTYKICMRTQDTVGFCFDSTSCTLFKVNSVCNAKFKLALDTTLKNTIFLIYEKQINSTYSLTLNGKLIALNSTKHTLEKGNYLAFFKQNRNGKVICQDSATEAFYLPKTVDLIILEKSQVGIKDVIENNKATIYPNPFNEKLTIKIEQGRIDFIKIVNIHGKMIIEKTNINKRELIMNTEFLESGIYIINIKTNKGMIHKKIIKQ